MRRVEVDKHLYIEHHGRQPRGCRFWEFELRTADGGIPLDEEGMPVANTVEGSQVSFSDAIAGIKKEFPTVAKIIVLP